MIDKNHIHSLAEQWLEGKDYFLTDVEVTPDNRILVEIDHAEGVWIDDCVALSRFIEEHLDREEEDFELEVGSTGLGQPFRVLRQYQVHEGDRVEVLTAESRKLKGVLTEVTAEGFVLVTEEKVRLEGEKRPKLREVPVPLRLADVKWTKLLIEI